MTDRRLRLAIVQPYLPRYRIPFFAGLTGRLAEDGIDCAVVAPDPGPRLAVRKDAADAPWRIRTRGREIRVLGQYFNFFGSGAVTHTADALIVPAMGTCWDTYRALLAKQFRGKPVGLWGHIKTYTSTPHPVDYALERAQLLCASQVFAYTPGGAAQARDYGIDPERVTTVMNSVDLSGTLAAIDRLSDAQIQPFLAEHGLVGKRLLAYFGALDDSKRIDVIAAVLDRLWTSDPDVVLLVGGEGPDRRLLEPAAARGQVVFLGYIGATEKALLARITRYLLMPGRIGLAAVESLALGLPTLTTDWPFHAPEAEYLVEGESRFTSADDPDAFYALVRDRIGRDGSTVSDGPLRGFDFPTVDAMIENFRSGVLRMMTGA